ncbi:hypothetical protein SprV_0902695100 [Sparganum proliferum]
MSKNNDKPGPRNLLPQPPESTVALQFKQTVHRRFSPHHVGSTHRRCLLEWTPFEERPSAATTFSLVNLSVINTRVPQAQDLEETEERVLTIRAPQSCLVNTDEAASGFYVTQETWLDPNQSQPLREAAEVGIGERMVRLLTEEPTPSAALCADTVNSSLSVHSPPKQYPAIQSQQEDDNVMLLNRFSRPGSYLSLNKAKEVYFTLTSEDTLTATPDEFACRKGPVSTSECPVPTVSWMLNLSSLSTCVYHGSVMDPHSMRLKKYFEAVDISTLPERSPATEDSISEIQNQEVPTDQNTSSKSFKSTPKA